MCESLYCNIALLQWFETYILLEPVVQRTSVLWLPRSRHLTQGTHPIKLFNLLHLKTPDTRRG